MNLRSAAAAFRPFAVKAVLCTAALWTATAGVYLLDPNNATGAPVPPHVGGILLSFASTVVALCVFVHTSPARPIVMWLVAAPWLTLVFAVSDRAPLIPTRLANFLVFVALAASYIRRPDQARRGRARGARNAKA